MIFGFAIEPRFHNIATTALSTTPWCRCVYNRLTLFWRRMSSFQRKRSKSSAHSSLSSKIIRKISPLQENVSIASQSVKMTTILCPKGLEDIEKENVIPLTSLPKILQQSNAVRKKRIILVDIPSNSKKAKCEIVKSKSSPTDIVTLGSSSPLDPIPLSSSPRACDATPEKASGEETDHYESAVFEFDEANLCPEEDPRCNTMAFITNQ
jgi:hypothetical protein